MNNINIKSFKGANINYSCNDCMIGNNFCVDFSEIPRIKQSECKHYDINFLLVIEKNDMKYLLSLKCKQCKINCLKELFNKNLKTIDGNVKYICSNCKKGEIKAGFCLTNEIIYSNNQKSMNKDYQNCINLIFRYNNQVYDVTTETNKSIPEVYYKLCKETKNKELEDLDILHYRKENENLSQYKIIEELNLKNGDVIDIEIRQYNGYGQ